MTRIVAGRCPLFDAYVYKSAIQFIGYYVTQITGQKTTRTVIEKTIEENESEELMILKRSIAQLAKSFLTNRQDYPLTQLQLLIEVENIVKKFLREYLQILNFTWDGTPEKNFSNYFVQGDTSTEVAETNNNYNYDGITILIDTIHGVKGETHTATLYLETYYYKNDIEKIIKFITGTHSGKIGKSQEEALKMAYVGMSRTTDLLCIAIDKESIGTNIDKLKKMDVAQKIKLIEL